jgi:hypothetical protein
MIVTKSSTAALQGRHRALPSRRGTLARFRVGEGSGQAAPADIARQQRQFFGRGAAVFRLDGLEGADRRQVVVEFFGIAALAEAQGVGDTEVEHRDGQRRRDQSSSSGFATNGRIIS